MCDFFIEIINHFILCNIFQAYSYFEEITLILFLHIFNSFKFYRKYWLLYMTAFTVNFDFKALSFFF